ncbi:unnamed protein product [Calypogeia fissa]
MAKKRKISGPAAVAKKKQRGGGGFGERGGGGGGGGGGEGDRRGKSEREGGRENAFETLWTRKKFDVLGQKQKKGQKKRVGQSRSLAVEKRKKTLLQEYREQGKGNKFVDRRFGEKDDDLPEEDKAILRFQKERQAQISRKSKFTLPEDDEEEETLTHGGMALSNVDDFNDVDSMQDDDDTADLDEDAVRQLNFGGGFSNKTEEDADSQQPKSKKEIMEDIIAKSKFYKAQKAKEKEEDEDLKEKLDSDFSELVKSRALLSLRPTRKDKPKDLLSKKSSEAGGSSSVDQQDKPDEFDKLIKEMVFDIRGHAGDRLKTTEEIVKEERERLEKLEQKRKKRMLGAPDSDEESEESDEEPGSRKQRKKKRLEISGDDLGENFVLNDEEQDGKGWVDEVLARKGVQESDSEEDGSREEDEEDEEDEEQVEEDNDDSIEGALSGSEQSDEDDLPCTQPSRKEASARESETHLDKGKKKVVLEKETGTKKAPNGVEEGDMLPFVINAPQTLGEFRSCGSEVDRGSWSCNSKD